MMKLNSHSPARAARHNMLIKARVNRICNHKALRFDATIEGYQRHIIGGRAYLMGQMNFYHEIAHCIEFGAHSFKKRIAPEGGGFRFKLGKTSYLFGRIYHDYYKTSAIRRELRTIAIQVKLAKMCGVKQDVNLMIEEAASAMRWMPDYYNLPDENRMEYCVKYIKSFYKTLNDDTIIKRLNEWLDKVSRTKVFKNADV